jgi:CheY-like chemotaxis protein
LHSDGGEIVQQEPSRQPARDEAGHVLVLDQDHAVAEAVTDLLRTHGLAVEQVRTEFEALQRLSALPTVRTLVVAGRSADAGAGESVAHFARRVVPGVVVITLNSEAQGSSALSGALSA